MRTILFFITLLFVVPSMAQDGMYEQAMGNALKQMSLAKTADDFNELGNTFERIAKAEKDKWQPYYYAALNQLLRAQRMEANRELDAIADNVDELLASAEEISPNNSELYCLKSMSATTRMMVDPAIRAIKYAPQSNKELEKAIEANPDNPRSYYLQAQGAYHTPAFFGGGKNKAKPLAEKSVELFKTFQPAGPFDPNWGQSMAENLVKQCQE